MADSRGAEGPWREWESWAASWREAQQRLWQTWMAMAQPAAGQGQQGQAGFGLPSNLFGVPGNWQDAQAHWLRMLQQAFPNVAPSAMPGVGGWFAEQWAAPLRLFGALASGQQGAGAGAQSAADWMTTFTNAFSPLNAFSSLTGGAGPAALPQEALMRGIAAVWGLPMDMWRRLTASLSLLPGDAALASKAEGMSHPGAMGHAELERFLSIPAFGYTREWQEQGQQAARDWLAYQRALGAYLGILTRIAVHTGEVVTQRFGARAAEGKPLEGLREVYDLFVDCAEDAYAEVVTAADYGRVSAEMMNAAMAIKRHAQAATEEMANAMNLPTRRELDTQHRQGQKLRRQVLALQEEVRQSRQQQPAAPDSPELDALRREVALLQAEMAELRASQHGDLTKAAKPARAAATGRAAKLESTEG